MRVLHVIQELAVGGAERVVVTLARAAGATGDEVAVAAAAGGLAGELAALGVPRFDLPLLERRPARVPGGILAAGRALRAWRPDVVHAHNPGAGLVAGLASLRARLVPGVVSVHGVPDEDYGGAARALRLAGLVPVACGPGVAAGLAEHGVVVAATVLNGVGPAPPPADRGELERELRAPRDRPLVVTVGRLATPKNPVLAVRAIAGVDATLLLVGAGPLRRDVERAAADAGVADRVVLAGVRADARALIGAADAVLIPSRSEGLPLVALEALAAGTPIVATAVRGLRELLTDGDTALLVPPDDPRALAAALRRLLADASLASSLAERGLQVAARHTEDAMVESYFRLYRRLAR